MMRRLTTRVLVAGAISIVMVGRLGDAALAATRLPKCCPIADDAHVVTCDSEFYWKFTGVTPTGKNKWAVAGTWTRSQPGNAIFDARGFYKYRRDGDLIKGKWKVHKEPNAVLASTYWQVGFRTPQGIKVKSVFLVDCSTVYQPPA